MSALNIRLFGRFCVQRGEQPIHGLDAGKVQELFCYLLLYRDRPHSREALASLLWGDTSTEKSKKYLRQTLWQLQTALDEQPGEGVLLVEAEWIQLNLRAECSFDVAAFEQGFALAQGALGKELDAESARLLEGAVGFYQGDLLEGWYHDWCLYERERLQNIYLTILHRLMCHYESRCEYEAALVYGARILCHDRACERTHRQLMRLHHLAGNRTAALRQYQRCLDALREELGVKPEQSTRKLYEQICSDELSADLAAQTQAHAAPPPSASLPEVLSRLKHLRSALSEIQGQVQQNINVVELFLRDRL